LGPDETYGCDGLAVDEVTFILAAPLHDWLRGTVHAAILMIGSDVVPPGLNAASDSSDHPHPGFARGLAGDAEIDGTGLIHGHALGS